MTADEPSILTIDMGGDFTQGKISGQKAIDNKISHMPYKELSFYYPEGSTKHGHLWIYIKGGRPVPDPKRVFGREKELKNIENFLKDKTALAITGFQGVGKSTLASMLVERMREWGDFAGICWLKVNETTDISEIIGSFFNFIRKPIKYLDRYKIADQINFLLQELNEASYLLVLDNFEILLNPKTNKPLNSKVGFSELVERANENSIRSKILFISCNSFSSESGIELFSYRIRGLDISAGIQLLRREGLNESEAELKKAVELSGGHPLALIFLAQLVREKVGTLSVLLNDNSLWIGEEEGMAERILNKVYNEKLSEEECKLLQYGSIFRQPVPARAIAKIANDPVWTESRVEKIAWGLCLRFLLQKGGENYWEKTLISEYARTLLSEKARCHKLSCEYYLSFPLPARPAKKEYFQFLIEAHYHACMAKEFDLALKIISGNNLEKQLDYWGNYTVLIDLYSKMLPENYGNGIPVKNVEAHGLILGKLGTAFHKLGEPRKAIEYSEQALQIIKESENKNVEGILLGNLGLSYRKLGELRKAIEYSEQALKITKEVKNRNLEGIILGNLGLAHYGIGELGISIEYYQQALKIEKKTENRSIEGILLGNLGLAYRKLGEFKIANKCHEQALKIAKKTGNRSEEATQLGNLGRVYHDLGDPKKAIEYYEEALRIAKRANRAIEGILLGNMGLTYHDLGDLKRAIEYHEQALKIAKGSEDRREEGMLFGNLGRTYHDMGDPRTAIEYYEQALKIAKETENRSEETIQLGNLGRAYNKLGELRKAIEYYEQELKIANKTENKHSQGTLLEDLGFAYHKLREFRKAIEYYEQAIKIAREL